jgi:hypothetical protein
VTRPFTAAEGTTVQPASLSIPTQVLAVIVLGLGAGVVASELQTRLALPWLNLVNAASPWLIPMFILGALWRRAPTAAIAGLSAGLLELAGYYVTDHFRHYPDGGRAYLLFWSGCAVIGGPLFGLAGWAWWRESGRLRSLGAGALPAAFFTESVAYGLRLHDLSSAILFAAIGVVTVALLGIHNHQHRYLAVGLLVAIPIGVTSELLVILLYRDAFGLTSINF